jgi:hypothetical protein
MWPFAKKEWFSCAQFDWIARQVGVEFPGPKHYRFKSKLSKRAGSGRKKTHVDFDKRWFLSLSEQARCSVMVHEFWHWVIWKKTMSMRKRYIASIFVGLPLVSATIILALVGAVSLFAGVPFHLDFLVFAPVLWVVLLRALLGRLMRRFFWPTEYDCDEAAVRYIGTQATLEVLKTFRLRLENTTHPPVKLRIERVNEISPRYPTPLVDFEKLQAEIPQSFVLNNP